MFTAVLSDKAQNSLALLGRSKVLPEGAYLAGGTALALQFGHRVSVDFDFFTPVSFDQEILARRIEGVCAFTERSWDVDTLKGKVDGINFSIFKYPYPVLFSKIKFLDTDLLDPRDIGAMKIAAIMGRGIKKDFIDLYELALQGVSLDDCLNYYDKKYHALENNFYSILVSIQYFAEAEESEMPVMLKPYSWENIKKFFIKETVRLRGKFF
jgi:hypothetical protein